MMDAVDAILEPLELAVERDDLPRAMPFGCVETGANRQTIFVSGATINVGVRIEADSDDDTTRPAHD